VEREAGMNLDMSIMSYVLGRYFLVAAPGHLLWELGHMPLYTLWETGAGGEIAFAALHCAGGDLLIAAGALVLAIVLLGNRAWPGLRYTAVATGAIGLGVVYTGLSEWLNVDIRQSWAYREAMPTLPVLGTGVSPLLQWVVVPAAGFWFAGRDGGGVRDRDPERSGS
jgi:hypothetical protein